MSQESENNCRVEELTKEELIKEVYKLNKSLKLQEDFLLNISHDLRNPINVILSILQCLKYVNNNSNDKEASVKQEEYRELIKRNTLKMTKLVDNLIDATKLEGDFYSIKKKNLDIINIVENIVTSIEKYADQKELHLIFDTNVEECITAFDPDCMDRIILNLLSNAIKFSPKGGKISIYLYVDKNNVKISIKDDGPGIEKEEQAAIFNRFVQAKQGKKTEQSGSGIGLDLVNYLVKLHDGHISLNSEVGKGSEFIVTIPNNKIAEEYIDAYFIKNNKVQQLEVEFSDIYL